MTRPPRAALPRLALFLLACPPVLIGLASLLALADGQPGAIARAQDLHRWASYPLALTAHILGGSAMLMLGLVQISPGLRRRFPAWHRRAGALVIAGGIAFALSGLWMNATLQAPGNSRLYDTAQDAAAVALLGLLGLGVSAIRRRDIAGHRAWMLRAYALGMGAATQTALLFPLFLATGKPPAGPLADLVLIGAWPLNLAIAEIALRRPR
jgi:uncharacterized membrane protein